MTFPVLFIYYWLIPGNKGASDILCIDNSNSHDPSINLALEEYALTSLDGGEDYLVFYINDPSVIVGRHQNTLEEIDREFVTTRGIHVVRRISGGGAVYHDRGNLNFSFVTDFRKDSFNNYRPFTEPVVRVLRNMGVPAVLTGRNDIAAFGKKISGNAQYRTGGRMFSHGTLLFDTDLDDVAAALRVRPDKIVSKGIKSVRSRVANIAEFIDASINIEEFKQALMEGIFGRRDRIGRYELSDRDWKGIERLAGEKYRTWEWNYGRFPAFNVTKRRRFPSGEIDVRILVKRGTIETIRFFGDFFGHRDKEELESALSGTRYRKEEIESVLDRFDLHAFFGVVEKEEIIRLVI